MNVSNENPPLFKTWNAWYWFVAGVLLVKILLLWWLAASYAG
jgi:hypothetical protein